MDGNSSGGVKSRRKKESTFSTRRSAKNRPQSLKAKLEGREAELLRWIGIPWPPAKGKHINCPFPGHDDKNPSWRWSDTKRAWFCSQCGGGDILAAVKRMKGVDFLDACGMIERDFLGYPEGPIAQARWCSHSGSRLGWRRAGAANPPAPDDEAADQFAPRADGSAKLR